MSMKLKNFFSILLSLALVLGLMPEMSLTAYAATETYTKLMNDKIVVKFNNYDWYIIADNSTMVNAGTVTLLAADTSFGLSKFHDSSNAYSGSTVKSKLDELTAEGGAFASVKGAIADTNLTDVGVNGAKLYLLSTEEANSLPDNVRKAEFRGEGCHYNEWWLRSPGEDDDDAAHVYGSNGLVDDSGNFVYSAYGVRPALKLDLSKVTFNSTTKTFSLIPSYVVTYKVVNGTWSDDSTADKTETVLSGSKPANVPTGMKASSGYTGGAWDTDPSDATITGATTFTYTFTAEEPPNVDTAYGDYVVNSSDDSGSLTNKTVMFNGKPWYIIDDNSTSTTEGSITLLAADTSFGTSKFHDSSNAYKDSTVRSKLVALTAEGGSFAGVKDAIVDTDLADVGVTGAKLYLLSTSEAEPYANFNFTGAASGGWWLRSPGDEANRAAFVDGAGDGVYGLVYANGRFVYKEFGVRPALKLDLSKVTFNSTTKTFSLKPAGSSVTLSGGANATIDGATSQTGLTGAMTTVTYTANTGYYFAEFTDITDNGITAKRTSSTVVTVSGTPTADATITVPDAVVKTAATYTNLMPTSSDTDLTSKQVTFNGYKWYIIADNSTAVDAGTVTLLAADTSFGTSKFHDSSNAYSSSTVKGVLDALTEGNGPFASVKDAIADTNLSDVNVTGAKLYLLSTSEAEPYKDFKFSGAEDGGWWLRSPSNEEVDNVAAFVYGDYGDVIARGTYVYKEFGVRPALKLNLSSVIFSSESNTFSLKPAATVTKAPTAKSLTYTGQAQGLVNAGEAENGTMQYALGTKNAATGTYSASIPTATDAGTYYVWYKAVGDDAHADSEAKCITVTISEALKIEFKANGGTGTMDDQKVTKNEVTKLKTHTFTREDHSFKDWNTREDGSGTSYSENAEVTLNENLILYAQWSKVEKHNHKFEKVEAVEAGCETDGNKSYYRCTDENCDEWYEDASLSVRITDKSSVILKATGHKWDDGDITKEATYDEEGVKTYICLNDPSHTKEETIPRLSSSSSSDSDSDSDSGDSGSSSSSNDSDSSSSDSGSSGGSGSKNNSVRKQVLGANRNVKSNVPSNHQVETGLPASDVGGKWIYNSDSDTWLYMKSDGTLAKKEWLSLDYNGLRYWYYFNDDGNMHTNWFDYKGERFYLMPKKDGWLGRMATGWKNIDNKWYYFDILPGSSQGRLHRSTVTPDGHTVGADGAWNGVGETPVGQE